ncbi:homogentisate 1,2-dioxygenase [Kribbella sp. VKM Ac-2527]|uniref:Homogentisate 1,2-dioxygenase n=1 Tax=Kribbella caucasensis TaxID=2512215 RepID=A0A4R6KI05_9ACTN|nr:homogentisate 1,2-dioxygenase [Kribbella sp. VKM Ac-2527]TDO50539.1 homogentisate 1,2-dioxygenase [Kribbella sp. VKM Ac-2527]
MFAKYSQGTIPRQGQTRWPEQLIEEHHGRDGFAGDCTVLHREHPTTKWTRVTGPLRPRGLQTTGLTVADADDPRALPTVLLFNDDVSVAVSRRRTPAPYYLRNLDGDTIILVLLGSGRMVSDFGSLPYGPREYLVIPKGTNYRLIPDDVEHLAYFIETTEPVEVADRTMLGHFLPFDTAVLEVPVLDGPSGTPAEQDGEWEVVLKRDGELTSIFYDFDPLDVVGWQGNVVPFRLKLSDIRPLTAERLDVPPVTHATFQTPGAWVCTFAPRPWQSADDAARVQPFHRNVDYDEVIIHLGGDEGVPGPPPGLLTVTPGGMNHGPSAALVATPLARLPFYILNLDTRRALRVTSDFESAEIPDFAGKVAYGAAPPPGPKGH